MSEFDDGIEYTELMEYLEEMTELTMGDIQVIKEEKNDYAVYTFLSIISRKQDSAYYSFRNILVNHNKLTLIKFLKDTTDDVIWIIELGHIYYLISNTSM